MAETLRLWDSLLAAVGPKTDYVSNPRFEFIDFVAVALVQTPQVRDTVIEGNDFSTCMENLQKAAETIQGVAGVETLLKRSTKVCLEWMKYEINAFGYENASSRVYQEVI
jgi:isocitrate/isopropylmalate dehydrogenase